MSRRQLLSSLALALALETSLVAQEPSLRWPGREAQARLVSDAAVTAAVALDAVHSWRDDDRKRAFLRQGCRLGLAMGVAEVAKRATHRLRPDGGDDKSFFSMHTAVASASAGWRLEVGVPLTALTGAGRALAGRHYLSDVAVGALDGWLASRICR